MQCSKMRQKGCERWGEGERSDLHNQHFPTERWSCLLPDAVANLQTKAISCRWFAVRRIILYKSTSTVVYEITLTHLCLRVP